jgi:hypothetical protein
MDFKRSITQYGDVTCAANHYPTASTFNPVTGSKNYVNV